MPTKVSSYPRARVLPILALLALPFLTDCAGKQVSQVRLRFLPESLHTVYVGIPFDEAGSGLSTPLASALQDHYRSSRELSLSRDLASADVHLDVEIARFLETPLANLGGGKDGQSRYLLALKVGFQDLKNKEWLLRDQTIEVSTIAPSRTQPLVVPEEALKKLVGRVRFALESLAVNGTAPAIGSFGYEGLEDDPRMSSLERANLYTATGQTTRDFRESAASDFMGVTNRAESNRQRAIDQMDRNGRRTDLR